MDKDNSVYLDKFRGQLQQRYSVNQASWLELKQTCSLKTLAKSTHFSQQGQYNRELAFLCEGVARVYFLTDKGTEITKYFAVPNQFLLASMETTQPSIINIQALTEITYISIPFPEFERLLQKYSELSLITTNLLLDYFGKKQQREIRLLANTALQNYQLFQEECPGLDQLIPHYHIASYLGITPTQLSRIRRKVSVHQHL